MHPLWTRRGDMIISTRTLLVRLFWDPNRFFVLHQTCHQETRILVSRYRQDGARALERHDGQTCSIPTTTHVFWCFLDVGMEHASKLIRVLRLNHLYQPLQLVLGASQCFIHPSHPSDHVPSTPRPMGEPDTGHHHRFPSAGR